MRITTGQLDKGKEMFTKDIRKESVQFAHLLHVKLSKKNSIYKTIVKKWKRNVRPIEKFFSLDRNGEGLG